MERTWILGSEDLSDRGQVTSPLSLGFLPSQSNCQNICHTYNLIVCVQPFAHPGAQHKHKACCVSSTCPSRSALPSPSPGEAPGLLCSLASTRVCPVETLAKGWCVKEARGDGFLLPWLPPALWAGLTEFSSTQGHTFPLELQLSPLLPLALQAKGGQSFLLWCPSTPLPCQSLER